MTVLVAYDGSEDAKKALQRAIAVRAENEDIMVLYVIATSLPGEIAGLQPDVTKAKAQEVVNDAINTMKQRGVTAMGVLKEGNVVEEILKYASEMKCSYVVIGSTGTSKIGRFTIGSVAERVARHSDRPVLIVR